MPVSTEYRYSCTFSVYVVLQYRAYFKMRLIKLCAFLLMLLELVQKAATKGTPTHGDLKCAPDFIGGARKTESFNQQLILTSYTFDCTAVITKWEANIMGRRASRTVEFQVWRLDQQSHYVLVGKNIYSSTTDGPVRRNKLTLPVSEAGQIIVQPGDIVGVFISTDGDQKIEFDGRRDPSISTYLTTSDVPLRSFSSDDLGDFQEVTGAPLIRVTVEQVEPSPVVPLPVRTIQTSDSISMRSLTTVFTYPDTSSSATPSLSVPTSVQPTTTATAAAITPTIPMTPDVGKRSEREISLWQKHKSLFISVAVCGLILVLLCIALVAVLGLYIKIRLKQSVVPQRDTTTHGEEEDTVNRHNSSSMFSLLPFNTARRNNLIAFKRRQTAPKSMTSSMDTERRELAHCSERVYEDMYDFAGSTRIVAKPQGSTAKDELQISMKENPSYTVLSEKPLQEVKETDVCKVETRAQSQDRGNLEQSENVYDVPTFARPLPCEYEVPVSGSPEMPSASYVTPQPLKVPHYENTVERSNVYTEIDI